MRVLGAADEFWRLRVTRVDSADVDFEWHDDILYREPKVQPSQETETWHIEAIRLDDFDTIVRVASFPDRESAEAAYARANEDLAEMTKTQFEESYLAPSDADEPAEEPGR